MIGLKRLWIALSALWLLAMITLAWNSANYQLTLYMMVKSTVAEILEDGHSVLNYEVGDRVLHIKVPQNITRQEAIALAKKSMPKPKPYIELDNKNISNDEYDALVQIEHKLLARAIEDESNKLIDGQKSAEYYQEEIVKKVTPYLLAGVLAPLAVLLISFVFRWIAEGFRLDKKQSPQPRE
jgi:hypothetical protein